MTASSTPGRRGNGLPGAAWGALVDLDPRLSEALLASLAGAGVPAFVEPAGGLDAFSRAAHLPNRPLDRLWVDPARADAARDVVAAEVADLTLLLAELEPGATAYGLVQAVPRAAATRVLTPPTLPDPAALPTREDDVVAAPEATTPPAPPADPTVDAAGPADASGPAEPGPSEDPDEIWRQIVAGFGRESDSPVPPWPVSEDVDPPRPRRLMSRPERSPEGAEDAAPRRRRGDAEDALPDWVEPEALDDDGHYEPPPPPPVPRPTPRRAASVLLFLAGFLLAFAPETLGQPRTSGVAMFGLLLTAGGAGWFVYLLRDASPTDTDPDDGAVV